MFGFTLKLVVCDYVNQKMHYQVLYLETKYDVFDKDLIKLKKPNSKNSYPRMLIDSKKIEKNIDKDNIYKVYFDRDDLHVQKHKTKELFYDYVFEKIYMELNENEINEYSEIKFDENYFNSKSTSIHSEFTIDLNIHIRHSIKYKLKKLN